MKRYFPHKLEFHRIAAARNSRNILRITRGLSGAQNWCDKPCDIYAERKILFAEMQNLSSGMITGLELMLRASPGVTGKLRRLIFFKILLNILLYLWRGWLRWWWFLWWWHDDDKMMIITWSLSWRWRMFSPGRWDARDPGPWWWCGCGETRPEAVSNICLDKLRFTKGSLNLKKV